MANVYFILPLDKEAKTRVIIMCEFILCLRFNGNG
jgi:hypothetical protein